MLQLPKTKINPADTQDLCKCRPVCKSRRRKWKGEVQVPSSELLLERKPVADCIRRWPEKVYPNSPCPLFAKSKRVFIEEKYRAKTAKVTRICMAPIDDTAPTPYLRAAELAKRNGALALVQAWCPFCMCGRCCACGAREYPPRDPDRVLRRRQDMRAFDARVQHSYKDCRVMYS